MPGIANASGFGVQVNAVTQVSQQFQLTIFSLLQPQPLARRVSVEAASVFTTIVTSPGKSSISALVLKRLLADLALSRF